MLPNELLKRIRQIEIYTDHLANDVFAGQYQSTFKGQGMEFAEVRQYVPGDDVRTIDWRVSARTRKPYVRRYVEERELTVMLVVDASGSMNFGTCATTKAETMAEAAATLAFSAIRNNDKVGLLVFTDEVEAYIPPTKGRRQVLRVIREVLYTSPQRRSTNLAQALEYVNRVLTRRAIIFVVSDFLTGGYARPLSVAARRHDLICLKVQDPREVSIPPTGLFELQDAETGQRRLVNLTPRLAEQMRFNAMQRNAQLKQELTRHKADLVELEAGQSPAEPLAAFFQKRSRRR
ncbi:MAG: DUF58 domain-containing protein [Armatimonadia bacterium]